MFRSKVSRLFCCFVSLLCLSVLFSISVSAASGNLINPNIMSGDWVLNGDISCNVVSGGHYYFRLEENGSVSFAMDETKLISGHSYSFSFLIPSDSDVNGDVSNHYSDGGFMQFSMGFSVGGVITDSIELCYVDSAKIDNMQGRALTFNFVCPSYEGVPCLIIMMGDTDSSNGSNKARRFYVEQLSLIDNDDNTTELKGIKGFLHNIWWDLVGGTCEEEDCPHYLPDDPHKSLADRITEAFDKDIFVKDSTLYQWFENLSDNITQFFEDDDGNSFSDWFRDLGTDLKNKLTTVKDGISSSVDSIGESISGSVDNVKLAIQTKVDELKQSFKDTIKTVTDWFDKFKPRVFLEFDWQTGYSINSSGDVVQKGSYIHNTVVTELFLVPEGSSYVVNYSASSFGGNYGYIAKYDAAGNFIERKNSTEFKDYALESGFSYRFMFTKSDLDFTQLEDISAYSNEHFTVHADEGWINALIYKLKLSIRGLFVPDESVINTFKSDIDVLLSEHLGVVYQFPKLISDYITHIKDLVEDKSIGFSIPALEFDFNGFHFHLWDETEVSFDFLEEGIFARLYSMYGLFLHLICGVAVLYFGKSSYEEMISN